MELRCGKPKARHRIHTRGVFAAGTQIVEPLPHEMAAPRMNPANCAHGRHMIGHIARSLGIAEITTPMIAESESEQEAIRLKVYGDGRKLQK